MTTKTTRGVEECHLWSRWFWRWQCRRLRTWRRCDGLRQQAGAGGGLPRNWAARLRRCGSTCGRGVGSPMENPAAARHFSPLGLGDRGLSEREGRHAHPMLGAFTGLPPGFQFRGAHEELPSRDRHHLPVGRVAGIEQQVAFLRHDHRGHLGNQRFTAPQPSVAPCPCGGQPVVCMGRVGWLVPATAFPWEKPLALPPMLTGDGDAHQLEL